MCPGYCQLKGITFQERFIPYQIRGSSTSLCADPVDIQTKPQTTPEKPNFPEKGGTGLPSLNTGTTRPDLG